MLDLCCGFGGVSRRFRAAGWQVVGVDIAEWVKPDIVCDVRALPIASRYFDFIWASEPCTQYSRLAQPGLFPNEPTPDLSIAYAIREIIRAFKPRRWVVENVWGARPYYRNIFGQVRAMVPGHAFWGSVFLLPNTQPHKGNVGQQAHERIRKMKRAIVPAEICDAIIVQL
jgi:SAM-dependent methyltransferase